MRNLVLLQILKRGVYVMNNMFDPNDPNNSNDANGFGTMNGNGNAAGGQRDRASQDNAYGARSEFSYYPQNGGDGKAKKKKKGGFLKGLAIGASVLACAAVVGAGSIFGYTLITGQGVFESSSSESEGKKNYSSGAVSEVDADSTDDRPEREVPTLEQLAALDNAMKIPDIVNKVSPSVVGITCPLKSGQTASGTGFVISEDGYIITNYHVIDGARSISVAFSVSDDTTNYTAELVGGDEQTDIAVLKIDKTGLTAVEFGKSSDLVVGELAITIGNPLGSELSGTVTAGIISSLNRTLTVEDRKMTLIQTDASINSGNSGGPLINCYGQVVGITSVKITNTDNLGFAIPIDETIPIVSDLIEYGYVKGRPIVGITGEDVSEIYSEYYGVPRGFIVRDVSEDGPAEKAGVKVGDIVIGIEGQLIESVEQFNDVKAEYKAGDTITISVYRDDKITDLEITLAEDKSALEATDDDDQQDYSYGFPFPGYGY